MARHVDACRTQFVASVLEGLFDDESHAYQFGTGLLHQVDDTLSSVSVGQEVVDEQHLVARAEEVAADADVIRALLGEGENRGGQHVLHRAGFLLLGEDDGQFEQIAHHDGRGNAAGLYCDDFVDLGRCEAAYEFHTNALHQDGIHLMVDEVVHFQDSSGEAASVAEDAVFQCLHCLILFLLFDLFRMSRPSFPVLLRSAGGGARCVSWVSGSCRAAVRPGG